MSRTLSRRMTTLVLIVFLGLSLPISATTREGRQPGVMDRLLGWADSLWALIVPHGSEGLERDARLVRVFDATSGDRGALIDPNGGD